MTDPKENSEVNPPEVGENESPSPESAEVETVASEESSAAPASSDEGIDAEVSAEIAPPAPKKEENPNLKWYIVHTYSGYEKKAKLSLQKLIVTENAEKYFGDLEESILIPTEEIKETKKGKVHTSERKFFPGYMFIRMELNDESWHLVKSTPKITGFVGNSTKPVPVPEYQVKQITQQMQDGVQRTKPRIEFEQNEEVKVIEGPFMNFNGIVEEVKPDKGKVRVMVSIFGRSTPVELDFSQVEKL